MYEAMAYGPTSKFKIMESMDGKLPIKQMIHPSSVVLQSGLDRLCFALIEDMCERGILPKENILVRGWQG